MPPSRVRVPFSFAALLGFLLPGCPLTDDYYVEQPVAGPDNLVVEPHCGDKVRNGGELCDTADLGQESCQSLQLGTGTLACGADCRFNVSGCAEPAPVAVCGDSVAQGVEDCDGADLRLQTCQSFGLQGTLACTAACDFDFSSCVAPVAMCGDETAQGAESCDGADLRGQTCAAFSFAGGTLACNSSCTFEFGGCTANTPTCGNGIVEGTEVCDGSYQGTETCETLDRGPGTLRCSAECGYDLSECGPALDCGGNTGKPCCVPELEVCDGVSNNCNEEVDEDAVCPEDATARTYDGHIYLLYVHTSQGGTSGGMRWDGGGLGAGTWNQEDYGQATTTCRAAGAQLGLGVELDLARIQTAAENDFAKAWIAETVVGEGMVWMGANDLAKEGRWVWGQDTDAVHFFTSVRYGEGTAVSGLFNDFTEGRPNSANFVDEDCGAFDSEFEWHWNDLDCGVPRLGLLCEQVGAAVEPP